MANQEEFLETFPEARRQSAAPFVAAVVRTAKTAKTFSKRLPWHCGRLTISTIPSDRLALGQEEWQPRKCCNVVEVGAGSTLSRPRRSASLSMPWNARVTAAAMARRFGCVGEVCQAVAGSGPRNSRTALPRRMVRGTDCGTFWKHAGGTNHEFHSHPGAAPRLCGTTP